MDLQTLGMWEHETHMMPLPREDRADYLVARSVGIGAVGRSQSPQELGIAG